MRRLPLLLTLALAAVLVAAAASASGLRQPKPPIPAPAHGLQTGVIPNIGNLDSANLDLEFARIRDAGATAVRLEARWSLIAPSTQPPAFNPVDPADPAYNWSSLDPLVIRAYKYGLNPILIVFGAPTWAQAKRPPGSGIAQGPGHRGPGPYKPSPAMFGQFGEALARRYSGTFQSLPRVRDFIAWNEPNNYPYLSPQRENGKPFSPGWYRLMVNDFALGVHRVHPGNTVIAGALLFNGVSDRISPLEFMRDMLCMSKPKKGHRGKKPKSHPTCNERSYFDVWTHHPYTRGDPFHHAQKSDDIMIGDLPRMRDLLDAAVTAHHIVSNRKLGFWVDEFSYDSRPPDPSPKTVPILLHARWVSESLYQMWRSGVSLASWFLFRDDPIALPPAHTDGQSGLWANQMLSEDLTKDAPKPALASFTFPFVAYRHGNRVSFWGRTPTSTGGRVAIQVGTATGWHTVGSARARRGGIFTGKLSYSRVNAGTGRLPKPFSYRRVVLADHPRSYWRLDDRGSVARDQLGKAPGVYEGSPERGVAGAFKGDKAVQFGSSSQVVLPPMSQPRTIELWVKTAEWGTLPLASFRNSDPQALYFGDYRGYPHASEGASDAFGYRVLNDNRWHYLVFTVAPGGTARLYVDGVLNEELAWHPGSVPSAASLAYDALLNRYFNGVLDEVAVYDHALTAQQVARHYAASGRTIMTRGMLRARFQGASSWPFSLKRPADRFVLAFG